MQTRAVTLSVSHSSEPLAGARTLPLRRRRPELRIAIRRAILVSTKTALSRKNWRVEDPFPCAASPTRFWNAVSRRALEPSPGPR